MKPEAVSVFVDNAPNRWIVREAKWGGRTLVDCGEDGERSARLIVELLATLGHVHDLADENAKGIDGYEQIAEWARNALERAGA